GHARAQDHAPQALAMGQPAARHRDDDRIVAGQQDVDPHDLEQRDPKRGLAHLAPAARDHGEPRGRIHHLCDRTHWTSLLLSPRAGASSRRPGPNGELIYRRNLCPGQRAKTPRAAAAASRSPSSHPTISLPEKNCAISCCAVSGASEPCTEFSPTDFAWILRIVPGAAFAGSVAPMISRYFAMAFSPASTCTTTGPDVMNSTSSRKNGRSRWTA